MSALRFALCLLFLAAACKSRQPKIDLTPYKQRIADLETERNFWKRAYERDFEQMRFAPNTSGDDYPDDASRIVGLENEIRSLKLKVEMYRRRNPSLVPPAVGRIIALKTNELETRVVIVFAEKDTKARVGDELFLSRKRSLVGRIKIVEVRENQAEGVLQDFWVGEASPPRIGDSAWVD